MDMRKPFEIELAIPRAVGVYTDCTRWQHIVVKCQTWPQGRTTMVKVKSNCVRGRRNTNNDSGAMQDGNNKTDHCMTDQQLRKAQLVWTSGDCSCDWLSCNVNICTIVLERKMLYRIISLACKVGAKPNGQVGIHNIIVKAIACLQISQILIQVTQFQRGQTQPAF